MQLSYLFMSVMFTSIGSLYIKLITHNLKMLIHCHVCKYQDTLNRHHTKFLCPFIIYSHLVASCGLQGYFLPLSHKSYCVTKFHGSLANPVTLCLAARVLIRLQDGET